VEIYPQSFPLARSYQTSLGIQRDLGGGFVLTADWARRQGENVTLGEVDENLFNRYLGSTTPQPVIPLCKTTPDYNPTDECSSGSITIWNDEGHAIYEGLLMKVQKRFSHRYQFQASYSYAHAYDENVWNDTNYQAGYGQYLPHQQLQISGTANLPWGFTISLNSTMISSTPGTANVSNYYPVGDVIPGSTVPLPGLTYGGLNSSTSDSQLAAAVANFNTSVHGSINSQGAAITNYVALPEHYSFGAPTIAQDFRLTKVFNFKERYHFNVFVEMFNAFNISNLTGYSLTLDNATTANAVCQQGSVVTGPTGLPAQSCSFGQPTARQGQTFGSAGPRAVQLGARFTF
jgi:hypothetical protein